jgi:putative dimethyl sulfoxide reductase chaperone
MERDWAPSKLNAALRTLFTARENIYFHLVKSFYGVFVLSELKQEIDLFYEYIELLGDSGKELKNAVDRYYDASENILTENIDCLEFEYNRLFVGPALLIAPPYESVYRTEDHLVMGETTLEVRRAYREANLVVRKTFKEPEDHIATELEYLAALQGRCLDALEKDDPREVQRLVHQEQSFAENHLLLWVPEFCKRIREGARMEFFRALADVLSLFVVKDMDILKAICLSISPQK